MFKAAASSYYMMGSHLTGWRANPPMLFHTAAQSLFAATWTELPEPARGPGANITYNSQSTFVFPLEFADGTVLYIYMGDRWNFYEPGSVRHRPPTACQQTLFVSGATQTQACMIP